MVISIDKEVLGNIICDAPSYSSESNKNWEYNAKLISCAPEMLKELQLIFKNYDKGTDTYTRFEQLIKKATL